MKTKYYLIEWPESQLIMEHSRFNECYLLEQGTATYAVPIDLWEEINNKSEHKWFNDLIKCPSQCYCYFNSNNREYCIYLRWRWDDPWDAYIVPIEDGKFDFTANWERLDVPHYNHDEYLKLQKDCVDIVNNLYSNIDWNVDYSI